MDADNNVLYVGKANNLKSRVSSYFINKDLGGKTRALVSQIKKIKITATESELEALLLEAFYIKKYQPKYNILQKDGKSYIRIRITIKDEYPAVLLSRREDDPKSIYFGPFTKAGAVRLVLKIIRKIYPYQSVLRHPKRICLYNHLGLCPCPPLSNDQEFKNNYRQNIRGIISILKGKSKKEMREFEKKRDILSKDENFEEAGNYQKKIDALGLIITPYHKPFEYDTNPNLRIDIRQKELNGLMDILNLKKLERIECYDISNTQGTNPTASMVVLTDGEIDKSQYRKFKIHTKGPNDFAMMQEVLSRRLKHAEWEFPDLIIVDGGKGQVSASLKVLQKNNTNIPLIGLAKRYETLIIPVIARSEATKQSLKTNKEYNFNELSLPKNSPALHLIMRIRDEAHRFAITYHKKLRTNTSLEIPS